MPMVSQSLRELPTHAILFFLRELPQLCSQFMRLWQFAQWLCEHWHIAAVTVRYTNELEADP
jgi:hypothetical protein